MSSDSCKLSEMTYGRVKEAKFELAVLPWAATEPHNYHLPCGTDVHETDAIAERACGLAVERGGDVVLLPTIPFGVQTTQQDFPLAINMNPTTQLAVLTDIVESLANSGIAKLVVLNGHGGNDFTWMLRELYGRYDVFIATVNWFGLGEADSIFTHGGDHANEMETSLCLHLVPNLVDALASADAGEVPRFSVELFNSGKAKTVRPWSRLTRSSGVGNPKLATAEKGKRYFGQVTEELASFLVELAGRPIDDRFPFAGKPGRLGD